MGTTHEAPFHRDLLTRALVALIDAYRWTLSPLIGQQCRFHPSCSCYARDALLGHGPLRGTWLAVRRLARCHPWSPGGIDDVPPPHPHNPKTPEPGH